jgi:hypothetical protein
MFWGTSVFSSVIVDAAAVMNSGVSEETKVVVIGNEAVVWPAGTVTLGGTVAVEVLPLVNANVMFAAGAVARVIVAVD